MTRDYRFEGEDGPVTFADLFGDKQTLAVYSFMYRPGRKRPCPMCTSLLSAWDGEAKDVEQRIALAVVARSPIERLVQFKRERGWRNLKVYSDTGGDYTRDYVSADDADIPAFNVFTRDAGAIRHFWSQEMGFETADPGQDSPRRARSHADLDHPRFNARGARHRLVSEGRIWRMTREEPGAFAR